VHLGEVGPLQASCRNTLGEPWNGRRWMSKVWPRGFESLDARLLQAGATWSWSIRR